MTSENIQTLSKSQIKRMKRNASKAKREAQSAKTTQVDAVLNPHEKLCNNLAFKGYSRSEIETALEEMWNFGMQYDSYDAALAYLEGKKAQKEADAMKEANSEKEAVVERRPESQPEVPEEASAEAEAPPAKSKTAAENNWGESETESESEKAPASASDSESQPQATDLASKLDVVANFPVLYDAIFALAEWATKAAKPHELMELCSIDQKAQPPALYTIIRRSIQCESDSEFRSVLTSFQVLTSGLFGAKLNTTFSASFTDTLTYARDATQMSKLHSLDGVDPLPFSNAIVNSVANQICKSFEMTLRNELTSSTTSESNGQRVDAMIQAMENEIDTLLSQQPSNSGGVVELMTRRDCRKLAAEKAGMITKLLSQGNHSVKHGHCIKSELNEDGKIRLLSDLFDGKYRAFQQSRSLFMELESRLSSANAAWSRERNEFTAELESCKSEMSKIDARKKELEKELEELNCKSKHISAQEARLKESLDMIYSSSSTPELDRLKLEHQKRAQLIKVEEQVAGVAHKLENLEDSMTSPSVKAIEKKLALDPIQVQVKLESYFILIKNYFATEADCVDFMTNRAVGLQLEAKELQREIAECTALGMATNVSKMTNSLDTFSRNVLEDQAVISALQREAESMRDELLANIAAFTSAGNVLTSSHGSILGSIGALLSRIRIDNSDPLFACISVVNSQIVGSLSFPHTGDEITSPSHIPQPVTQPPPPVAPIAKPTHTIPKLSWAAAPKKAGVKSLRDIQKEEMTKNGGLIN